MILILLALTFQPASGSAGANRSISVCQLAWHRMRPCMSD